MVLFRKVKYIDLFNVLMHEHENLTLPLDTYHNRDILELYEHCQF